MTTTEVGSYRKRVEDPRLLRGEGQYVDDLPLDDVAEVAFLRSAYAHARITRIDVDAARAAPGVLAVWTGEYVQAVPRIPSTARGVEQHHLSPLPPIAWNEVSLAGYPLAAVIATDRQLARDAVDLIEVDYEPLPTITSAEDALAPEAPLVFPEFGTNLAYTVTRDSGDVRHDLSHAPRRLQLRVQHSRLAQVPMEPRAIAAHYDRATDRSTVWRSTQPPFLTRNGLSIVLGRPEDTIRVIAPDVGGAFGAKSSLYPDEVATVLLAMHVDRPVAGCPLAVRISCSPCRGGTRSTWSMRRTPTRVKSRRSRCAASTMSAASSSIPCCHAADPRGRLRHRRVPHPVLSRRGAGRADIDESNRSLSRRRRPEAAFVAERTVEEIARTLRLDPVEFADGLHPPGRISVPQWRRRGL